MGKFYTAVVHIIALGARHHAVPLSVSSYPCHHSLAAVVVIIITTPLEPDIMPFPCHHHRRHCYRHHRHRHRHPATDISIIIIVIMHLHPLPRSSLHRVASLRVSRRVALSCRRHTRHDRSWKLRALFYLFQNFASFSFIVLVSVS